MDLETKADSVDEIQKKDILDINRLYHENKTQSHQNDENVEIVFLDLCFRNVMKDQMKQITQLGKGAFGKVNLMRSCLDNRLVAVKSIPFRSPLPPWSLENYEELVKHHSKIVREIQALSKCQSCQNIVKYYASWIEPDWKQVMLSKEQKQKQEQKQDINALTLDETSYYSHSEESKDSDNEIKMGHEWPYFLHISMEPLNGLTLRDWIERRNQLLTCDDFQFGLVECAIFTQIVCGLVHLHKNDIIHRDVKPSNILMSCENNILIVKLTDFGLASICKLEEFKRHESDKLKEELKEELKEAENIFQDEKTTGIGTNSYCAPELQCSQGKKRYGAEVDMFSLGLILIELIIPVQTQMERAKLFEQVKQHRTCPKQLWCKLPIQAALIERLLSDHRPTSQEVLDTIFTWIIEQEKSQDYQELDKETLIEILKQKDKEILQLKFETFVKSNI